MEKNVLENGIWHNSDLDKNAAYKDDRIAIVDSIQSLKNGQTELASMVKVDAVLLVFCVKGKASLFINGIHHLVVRKRKRFALYQWRIENDTRERFVHLPS